MLGTKSLGEFLIPGMTPRKLKTEIYPQYQDVLTINAQKGNKGDTERHCL